MAKSTLKFGIGLLKTFEDHSKTKELLNKPKHSENSTSPSNCPYNGTFYQLLNIFSNRGK